MAQSYCIKKAAVLIISRQYVKGKISDSSYAHRGKHSVGIRAPENKTMGVSNRSIIIEVSREKRKMAFRKPPRIVEDNNRIKNITGNRSRFRRLTFPV